MKIHIIGASGAGSTTLGKALADEIGYIYLDTDAYFWLPSTPPFRLKRDVGERNAMLKADFTARENLIVGGSTISNWGAEWHTIFDLIVFLYVPHEIRMHRLRQREIERYGDKLITNPQQAETYQKFMEWARGYDDNSTNGRNLQSHTNWLKQLTCPVLEITGDTSVEERIKLVRAELLTIEKSS